MLPSSEPHLLFSLMSPHLIMYPIKDVFLIRLPGICCCCRDLSEQIKQVTKDVHAQAENTELMLSFQRGQVTLQQYKVPESRPTGVTFTISCHILTRDTYTPPLLVFSCSCARCTRSTWHWRKRWTETVTIRPLLRFTSQLNWPGWRPSRKTWSSFLVRTGGRRSWSLQPPGGTATGSDRCVCS